MKIYFPGDTLTLKNETLRGASVPYVVYASGDVTVDVTSFAPRAVIVGPGSAGCTVRLTGDMSTGGGGVPLNYTWGFTSTASNIAAVQTAIAGICSIIGFLEFFYYY